MEFNEVKFEAMVFGANRHDSKYRTPSGETITTKQRIKDLGVIMEDNLLFHRHIINITAKGHRIAE